MEKPGATERDGGVGGRWLGGWFGNGKSFLARRSENDRFGLMGLVLFEPAFEQGDGGAEVVAEGEEEVDVVEVFVAAEAVGEVVAGVDGGAHFAAAWAEEAEVAFADFGRRPLAAESGDGDGHGQVVADSAEQFVGNHGVVL